MQTSVVVQGWDNTALNRLLRDGWEVHSMCPMPSSCATSVSASGNASYSKEKELQIAPHCLVILEKEG